MAVGRMTLSDATIAQILATMTEHLGRMTDPHYSKKLREDLLTLPDDVMAMNKKNQALLDSAEALRNEIKKKEDDANERIKQRENILTVREANMQALDARKKEAEAIEARNKAKEADIKAQIDSLTSISQQHLEKESAHIAKAKELDQRQKDLDAYRDTLSEKAKEIAAYEQDVNETATQMSGLVKSKLRK